MKRTANSTLKVVAAEPTGPNGWTRAVEWPGNPSLGLLCSFKNMRVRINCRRVTVIVYGGGNSPYEGWGSYVCSDGPDSDMSFSGFAPGCASEKEVQAWIDKKYKNCNA